MEDFEQCSNETIAGYEQAIAANPSDISNYWHLGLAWLLQGEAAEAQSVWWDVLAEATLEQAEDWMTELLQVLQTALLQQLEAGKFSNAEGIGRQILNLDADQSKPYFWLGQAIAQQGRFDEAIACWQQTAGLDPTLVEADQQQGEVCQKLEQFDQAILHYTRVLELQPDRSETHYQMGLCLLKQNRWEAAIAHFTTATQLKPDFSQAYGDGGFAQLRQGNFAEAIVCFKQMLQLQADFVQSYLHWQSTLAKQSQSNREKANAELLRSLNLPWRSAEIYIQFGKMLTQIGQLDQAVIAYQKALEIRLVAAAYFELGSVLAQKNRPDLAIFAYRKALEVQPNFLEAHLCLGEILIEKADFNQALEVLQTALSWNLDQSRIHLLLGKVWYGLQHYEQAAFYYQKFYYQKSLKSEVSEPDAADALLKLAAIAGFQGDAAKVVHSLQQFIQRYPDSASAVSPLLKSLRRQGTLSQQTIAQHHLEPVDVPTAYYETTQDWANANSIEATQSTQSPQYIQLDCHNSIALNSPKTIDRTIHFSFRFGEAIALPGTFVATVPNGRCWLSQDQTSSALITLDNRFLSDLSPEFPIFSPGHPDRHPDQHSLLKLKKLPPFQAIDGTVVVLSGLLNNLYFHWMLDVLPRVELLKRSGIDFAKVDYFWVDDRLPFQQETLQILEIPTEKILKSDRHPHIQAKQLIAPSYPGSVAWMPRWTCEFLRYHFLSQKPAEIQSSDRLYISRRLTANRRIINEAAVIQLLTQYDFKFVTLEQLSVVEQAALLSTAKVVIAPHGGGLTNLAFCSPGTKVIELFSPHYVYPCYWLVSNLVDLEYYYLLGELPLGSQIHQLLYPDPRIEDIYIDLDKLVSLMRFANII